MARVVVVDDVPELRELAGRALGRHGHEVVGEAGDGREAIEVVASLRPDVVLLDVRMPNMTGLEALPIITRLAPDAKVVVVNSLPTVTVAQVEALGGHALVHRRDTDGLGEAVSAVLSLTQPLG